MEVVMRRFVLTCVLLLSAISVIGFLSPKTQGNRLAPRIKVKDSTSTNWSGYAAFKTGTTFSDVKGSWVQPAANCSSGTQYASFWVGIDGYSSNTVEQIGTDADCSSGQPVYYAWYEMYPQFPVTIPMAILPGDTIYAEVQYTAGGFVLTLRDGTQSFSTPVLKMKRADRSSAEWVAEAPSGRGGVLPLADFGTVSFTGSYTTGNGHTGTIGDASWQDDPMTMVTQSNQVKATPSRLKAGGSAFSVTWSHQ
jgi:hypothetical protein